MLMTLYERIRQLRINAGMSQDDLARAMGYKDRSMITKIESGKVDISQKKILAFAQVLNTTPGYLMGWTDEIGNADTSGNQSADLGAIQPDEADIIKTYRSLPAPGKQYVQQQLVAARLMYGEKPADSAAADK